MAKSIHDLLVAMDELVLVSLHSSGGSTYECADPIVEMLMVKQEAEQLSQRFDDEKTLAM